MKKEQTQNGVSGKKSSDIYTLILVNDDINTFDHVIQTLVDVCGHDRYQAEQCALITHFKGCCEVKTGLKVNLVAMSRDIRERGMMSRVVRQEVT
ncbi:MAG: ATP-dependent Clp protease adaptor ClpS [Bacteroidales bacterium]